MQKTMVRRKNHRLVIIFDGSESLSVRSAHQYVIIAL